MKKLSSYLSAGIAATATFQSSDAATVVTLHGPGARSPLTTPATPVGIYFGSYSNFELLDITNKGIFAKAGSTYFTAGSDLTKVVAAFNVFYSNVKTLVYGAQPGSANYANISFNGNDGVYEAVGQFNLTGVRTGFLVALAINNSPASALSISAGKAAIDAVPEPSAIALLALGAGGMAMRRRRKVA